MAREAFCGTTRKGFPGSVNVEGVEGLKRTAGAPTLLLSGLFRAPVQITRPQSNRLPIAISTARELAVCVGQQASRGPAVPLDKE